MRTTSIYRRVLGGALALLAVALAAVGTVVTLTLRHDLDASLRSHVTSAAQLATQLAGALPPQSLADRLSTDQVTATVRSGGATVIGTPTPGPKPPTPPTPGAAPAPPAPRSVGGGQLRVVESLADGEVVTLTASEAPIDSTVRHLVELEVLVSIITLAVAAVLLRTVMRLALAPLGRVAATATAIAAGAPGQRLHPSRTDTELGSMAAAFDAMVDALEAAIAEAQSSESTMRQFLADASHELRTPVAAVQATLETLLREDPPRAEREDLEVLALRELGRLSRLVGDLLRLARAESHAGGAVGVIDINALVVLEVDRLRRRIPGAAVELRVDRCTAVAADGDRLSRALANVLDNAAAADPEGTVTVGVEDVRDGVEIVVDDTGRGVAPADRERIFERFVRLDPARHQGGAGLGLAIARAALRRDGGDVRCVEPPDGCGGRFVISIPRASRAAPSAPGAIGEVHRADGGGAGVAQGITEGR